MEDQEKPKAVKILGMLWMGLGAFMVLCALLGGFNYYVFLDQFPKPPNGDGPFGLLFTIFPYAIIPQCIVGVVGSLAGWNLLSGARWARVALEAIGYLLFAFVVSFGGFWCWALMTIADGFPSGISIVFWVVGVMGLAFYVGLAGAAATMVWSLRSEEVREWVEGD